MRRITHIVSVALFAAISVSAVQARGPLSLFDHNQCDSGCCDASPCDAGACDSESYDAAPSYSDIGYDADRDSIGDSGDDSGCFARGCNQRRCGMGQQLTSHASGSCNHFRSDCCCNTGPYCSLFGGWNLLNDYHGEQETVGPPPPVLEGTFSDGWAIGLALGRRFNTAIRGELELAFRSNTADRWSVNGVPGDWSGHVFGYSGMANLYHDFGSYDLVGITPYVGAGIGLMIVDGDLVNSATSFDIDGTAFAYQFIAGGSKPLSNDVDIFAEYRFFGTTNLDITNSGAIPAQTLGEHNAEIDNIFFGLRIRR